MDLSSKNELYGPTVNDLLDQIETLAGRVGMNTAEQSFRLLSGLDEAYIRIQAMENETSRALVQTRFDSILARLRGEAGTFLRDLGGTAALRARRAQVNPPAAHDWWFLEDYLDARRKAALRRTLTGTGIAALALLVLVVVYNTFLAPDPAVAARYGHQQAAQDRALVGDYAAALSEAEQGLTYAPDDPALLLMRGVLQEQLGDQAAAEASFAAATAGFAERTDYFVTRGQSYLMVNQPEKALADVQAALALDPNGTQAHLLLGQIYEVQGQFQLALEAYDTAFAAADSQGEYEMAALARTRYAMLMQSMNGMQMMMTETPAP